MVSKNGFNPLENKSDSDNYNEIQEQMGQWEHWKVENGYDVEEAQHDPEFEAFSDGMAQWTLELERQDDTD